MRVDQSRSRAGFAAAQASGIAALVRVARAARIADATQSDEPRDGRRARAIGPRAGAGGLRSPPRAALRGTEVNRAFYEADLVDRLIVTICPLIVGRVRRFRLSHRP